MGSMGRQSSFSTSYSNSTTKESSLSKEQLQILQNRENIFNDYFFPELKNSISALDANSSESNATMSLQANQINSAYNAAQKQTNQNLAQQGLLGTGNGVAASLTAQNTRDRASALANAYYNTMSNNASQKANLLGIGASLMTTPTTSAQYHTTSSSSSKGKGSGSSVSVS